MTNQAVVAIIIRLAGIVIGLEGIAYIVGWAAIWGAALLATPSPAWAGISIGLGVVWLLVSAILIGAPGVIAHKLLPSEHREQGRAGWSVDEFQAAAFSVVGVYLLATVLTDWGSWVTAWHLAAELADRRPGVRVGGWDSARMIAASARLAIGVWLLFGARGLRGLLRKARTAGLK